MEIYYSSLLLGGGGILILPHFNGNLPYWNLLGFRSCFSLLEILPAVPFQLSVSVEKSTDSLIRAPSYDTSYFSLGAFKILSLSLHFAILIMMRLGVGLF